MADAPKPAEKPAEAPVVPDDPEVPPVEEEHAARPEWLDPRFKSVEDQAKAYRDSEKAMHMANQRRSEVERELAARSMVPPPQPPAEQAPPEPEVSDDMFWQNPVKVIEKVVQKQLGSMDRKLEPLMEDRFTRQLDKYANDEDFKTYSPQIEQVFKLQPQLRNQPGAVDYVYNFLRAQNFNPDDERRRIEAKVRNELSGKAAPPLEGGSPPAEFKPTPKVELSEDERRAALRFYSDLPPQEAYKKYHATKAKWSAERGA